MKKQIVTIILLLTIISSFTIQSCSKEKDPTPSNQNNNGGGGNNNGGGGGGGNTSPEPCEYNHYGKIIVYNNLSDPYKVYIDNSYKGTVSGSFVGYYGGVASGNRSMKFVQQSGYVFYPDEISTIVTVVDCETSDVTLR